MGVRSKWIASTSATKNESAQVFGLARITVSEQRKGVMQGKATNEYSSIMRMAFSSRLTHQKQHTGTS